MLETKSVVNQHDVQPHKNKKSLPFHELTPNIRPISPINSQYLPSTSIPSTNGPSPAIPFTALPTQSASISGSPSICGCSASLLLSPSRCPNSSLAPRQYICIATITIPRMKVMYSAMPSSRSTDW